jgi:dihydrofolate reductase
MSRRCRQLKQQAGRELQAPGSTTLVRNLLAAGLVDELRLMVHPLVVGTGRRLFEPGDDYKLDLVESTTFGSGVISAIYAT